MSRLRSDENDLFSPIRFDASVTSSDISGSGLSNVDMTLSFTDEKNKSAVEDSVFLSEKQSELKCKDKNGTKNSESINTCASVSNKNLSNSLNTKKLSSDFAKLKTEKIKDLKNALRKEKSEYLQVMKEKSIGRENILDCHVPKSNSSGQTDEKRSRPTSLLLSKDEIVKSDALSNVKRRQKNINQSQNDTYSKDECTKLSVDNKLKKNFNNLEDKFVKSTVSKVKMSPTYALLKKSSDESQQENLELALNPLGQYEASVEKMVHDCISYESAKMRQDIYMQQMSLYRQINKMKHEMEKQHVTVTERLFKVIEELVQINTSLKSGFVEKN